MDSKGIIVVICSILSGFAIMFRILMGPYDSHFASYTETFFSMFEIGILGSFNREQFKESQSPMLTMGLFVILLVVVYIVALVSEGMNWFAAYCLSFLSPIIFPEFVHCVAERLLRSSQ